MVKALEHSNSLTAEKSLTLKLAALLHDADDRKYFDDKSKNASNIIQQCLAQIDANQGVLEGHEVIVEEALRMIEYVSASKNGNKVPKEALGAPEMLWVRFCDRLEAIGAIGAVRCY